MTIWLPQPLVRKSGVQCFIEPQDVDARLPQEAQFTAFRELRHYGSDIRHTCAARFCHPFDLRISGLGTEVRIQPAAARGQQVGRDSVGEAGILLAKFVGRSFYAIDEFLTGGAQVRSA